MAAINPLLSRDDCRTVALFISASIEGTTIFAVCGKPWEARMPKIKSLAVRSPLQLVETLKPGDVKASRGRRIKMVV